MLIATATGFALLVTMFWSCASSKQHRMLHWFAFYFGVLAFAFVCIDACMLCGVPLKKYDHPLFHISSQMERVFFFVSTALILLGICLFLGQTLLDGRKGIEFQNLKPSSFKGELKFDLNLLKINGLMATYAISVFLCLRKEKYTFESFRTIIYASGIKYIWSTIIKMMCIYYRYATRGTVERKE